MLQQASGGHDVALQGTQARACELPARSGPQGVPGAIHTVRHIKDVKWSESGMMYEKHECNKDRYALDSETQMP